MGYAGHDPVQKLTLIPRGQAKGLTWFVPGEDPTLISKQQIFARIVGALGGRATEEVIWGEHGDHHWSLQRPCPGLQHGQADGEPPPPPSPRAPAPGARVGGMRMQSFPFCLVMTTLPSLLIYSQD